MAIRIGSVWSLSNPESETITPDDRQQTIEILGGVSVQDFGHIEAGDKVAWTLDFSPEAWETVKGYWDSRVIVEVKDAGGVRFHGRVVVKSYRRKPRFESHITANIEIWRS